MLSLVAMLTDDCPRLTTLVLRLWELDLLPFF